MKKIMCLAILTVPLYADDGKFDLPLYTLMNFKISESSNEICSDPKSATCKKQVEDIDNYVKESLCLLDLMRNFNPKENKSSKTTWTKQKENTPFLWKTVEARHAKGIPVTSMQKYQEAYLLASEAYITITGFLTTHKLLDAKDQISFQEFLEKTDISKKQIDMQIEVYEKYINELKKQKKELESKKDTDPSEIIIWAAQNLEEVENTKSRVEKAQKDGANKERQRQTDK